MSNVICLVNPQNGSWVLFTKSQKFTISRFVISRFECTYSARHFLWVWVPGSTLLLGNLFPCLWSRGFCPGLFLNKLTLLLNGLVLKSPLLFGPGLAMVVSGLKNWIYFQYYPKNFEILFVGLVMVKMMCLQILLVVYLQVVR